jgi:5-formyltetrahydrofolate cyclo-ligase
MNSVPKSIARKAAFAARKLAHASADIATPEAAVHLLAAIGDPRGLCIAGYMPIRTEIDPLPAMRKLHAEGARLCVPVIEADGHPLKFRQWRPDGPMTDGPFGAQVPADGAWLTPEVVIVPLVAFDLQLNRLGYGGGFYDRTLEQLRRTAPVRAIGFAYAGQELPNVPQEPTDQPIDMVVTEHGPLAAPRVQA